MNKFLLLSLILGVFAMPINHLQTTEYENIQDCFKDAHTIEITVDNISSTLKNDTPEFVEILSAFENMLEGSHQNPAYGVSLDDLTREEKTKGVWLEFYFPSICSNTEMPFDSLLINVVSEYSGFNIIRCYQGKYDGRCFYIHLIDKDMSKLYNTLLSLS